MDRPALTTTRPDLDIMAWTGRAMTVARPVTAETLVEAAMVEVMGAEAAVETAVVAMDEAYKRNMQQSATALGHVAMSLQHFSVVLMRIGLDAGVLTPDRLAHLREETIRGLKNSQTVGVSMEMDADAIGQALGMLGPMLDAAIDDAQA